MTLMKSQRTVCVLLSAVLMASLRAGVAWASPPVAGVKHVVIIGVDGMSPNGVEKAATPNMHALMKAGAYTLHARGVMPTVSSPNWASMIMGAGPEQHGVTSNDWEPDKFDFPPTCKGSGGIFPTIFGVLREQRPHSVIAAYTDWDGFVRLVERNVPDVMEYVKKADETNSKAIAYLKEKKPTLTFIHYDHVDAAGHDFGWGTPEYYQAVAEADRLIGEVREAVTQAGIFDRTIMLVSADHGGKGEHHGGNSLDELEIPWIIAGPGIAVGKEITAPVDIYDTAATVAYIFGLTPPACWIGRPVLGAFKSPRPPAGADVRSKH